jgi:hypothetical protein
MSNKMYQVAAAFVNIDFVETILCGREQRTSCLYFPHYSLIRVKSVTTDLHRTIVTICEFRENRRKECCTLLVGVTGVYRATACTMAQQSCCAALSTSHAEDAVMGSSSLTYCRDSGILQSPSLQLPVPTADGTRQRRLRYRTDCGN